MSEAEDKFGSKSKTNAGLTLGIIGTALGAGLLGNNNSCCGNGGILGNLFGNNGNCACEAKTLAMAQGQQADNLAWANRVQSMQDDIAVYSYLNSRDLATNQRIGNEVQILTNQIWNDRVQDLKDKSSMYVDLLTRDNAQNIAMLQNSAASREQDIKEKTDIFERLNTRIVDLEKKEAAVSAALPLMFELTQVKANKYTDDCCCKAEKANLIADAALQRQLDHKIDGQLKYAYSDLCAPVPNISPLYCSPFTTNGSGTVWNGFCGTCNQSL